MEGRKGGIGEAKLFLLVSWVVLSVGGLCLGVWVAWRWVDTKLKAIHCMILLRALMVTRTGRMLLMVLVMDI